MRPVYVKECANIDYVCACAHARVVCVCVCVCVRDDQIRSRKFSWSLSLDAGMSRHRSRRRLGWALHRLTDAIFEVVGTPEFAHEFAEAEHEGGGAGAVVARG